MTFGHAFILIAAVHITVQQFSRHIDSKCRWWLAHAIINTLIAAFTVGPHHTCVAGTTSSLPLHLAVWLHVYHAVFYEMTRDDVVHHILFVPTLGGTGLYFHWGGCLHRILFYACGAPGACMYFLLALKRTATARVNEPFFSMITYSCIRMPMLLVVVRDMLLEAGDDSATWKYGGAAPKPVVHIFCTLTAINAVMYGWQFFRRFLRSIDISDRR